MLNIFIHNADKKNKNSQLLISLLFLLLPIACNNKIPKEEISIKPEWAIKFADAVLHNADSLIYYDRKIPKYEYDYAFLGSAIYQLNKYDRKYADYMKAYIDYFVGPDGDIKGYKFSDFNIDRVRPGLNMLTLYEETGNDQYKRAAHLLTKQMEEQPRTISNGYWHKKIYPWQMWLDGIYMAHPFLCKYAIIFNKPEWFDEVVFQVKLIYEKTLDKQSGLIYHAWDESHQQEWCNPLTGQSQHFWSRATGWYIMAIVDILDYLPTDHPERPEIIDILQNLSDALINVRDVKSGLWYQVLDMGFEQSNYIEASGSAMFIYAFAKAAKKGYLSDKFLEIANESFDSLIENLVIFDINNNPVLTHICGACGLGGNPYRKGDYNYYVNEKQIDNDPKGVAAVIIAAIELNK